MFFAITPILGRVGKEIQNSNAVPGRLKQLWYLFRPFSSIFIRIFISICVYFFTKELVAYAMCDGDPIDLNLRLGLPGQVHEGGTQQMAPPQPQPPQECAYPGPSEKVIGGDSVDSIRQRFLWNNPFASPFEIQLAEWKAEDQFEVKSLIIKKMAVLDPTGDWMGRGALALENPQTSTGEDSLKNLHKILEDLNRNERKSSNFWKLQEKVFLKKRNP